MPSTSQILSELSRITNDWTSAAILWHLYYASVAIGIMARSSARLLGLLLAIPLFSVAAMAWINTNPFNCSVFTLAGLLLLILAFRLPHQRVIFGTIWMVCTGSILFLFGWIYPHFLKVSSTWMYLYATPIGLIPCPTLCISIGASLMVNGLGSRAWIRTLALLGLFYGSFGTIRLGVTIDVVLLFGALAAIVASFNLRKAAFQRSHQVS